MELLPPDPLALTGPFPLEDIAPQNLTREQIESMVAHAPKLFQTGGDSPNGDVPAKAVARISSRVIVKYGTQISLGEGRTMMKVQQQVQISMPQVYDCWASRQRQLDDQAAESVYIIMQYIPGKVLAQIIEDLNEAQTRDLTQQLTNTLNILHTIHHTVPGPVDGGRAIAPRLFTSHGAGPFYSVQDLINWFNDCLKLCQSFGKAVKQQHFDGDIKDLVMCHLDIHLHNLLVDESGKLWLIDWDCAGFYPEFFEYVCIKGYAEFLPMGMRSAAGAKFLQTMADAMETLEGRRMNAKFNAIGYALRK